MNDVSGISKVSDVRDVRDVREKVDVAPLLPRVARQHLHDTVVEHLRRFVVEGTLAPGMKLNERALCDTLGISRTPLREALKVLAADGLIEISPNRGASVAVMSDTDINELFELLSGIESFAGELACQRITLEEVDEIKALNKAMLECKANQDLLGYYSLNQAIHDAINRAARNNALRRTFQGLNQRLQALRFHSNHQTPKWDRAARDHDDMLEALDARDGARLANILRLHLLEKRDAVLQMRARGV